MRPETLLYRQVNDNWIQQGVPSSQTFRPTEKDEGRLSVYDADVVESAEAAYIHWTGELGLSSVGVLAVTEGECSAHALPVVTDGTPFPSHATIDFTKCESKGEIKRLARELTEVAVARNWQYRPS